MFGKSNDKEIKKIEQAISGKDYAIEQTILELGKKYYEEHRNDTLEEPYAEYINRIINLEDEKSRLYDQNLKIQGLRECKVCHCIISYSSSFCNSCGSKVETDIEETGEHHDL